MNPEERNLSKNLKFDSIVSDKEYQSFFLPKVIEQAGVFHETLELRAENQNKIPEPLGRVMEDGLRIVARRLVLESKDCIDLNRFLKAKIDEGELEESKKDEARFAFILTFLENHRLN